MAFRGAYLGTPGSMFMFAHVRGKVSSSTSRKTTYRETLGGNLRAQVSPEILREWSCSIPMAEQDEITHLAGLVTGLYGLGPFSWIPVTATMSNVLSIAGSLPGAYHRSWSGAGVGVGVWDVPGLGRVNHAVVQSTGTVTLAESPIAPGFPVTGAVYLNGGILTVDILDSSRKVVSTKRATAVPGTVERVHASIPESPAGSAYVRLSVTGSTTLGLPSVSWTKDLKPWVPGNGSNQVHLDEFDSSVFYLDSNESLEDITFKVKELSSSA